MESPRSTESQREPQRARESPQNNKEPQCYYCSIITTAEQAERRARYLFLRFLSSSCSDQWAGDCASPPSSFSDHYDLNS